MVCKQTKECEPWPVAVPSAPGYARHSGLCASTKCSKCRCVVKSKSGVVEKLGLPVAILPTSYYVPEPRCTIALQSAMYCTRLLLMDLNTAACAPHEMRQCKVRLFNPHSPSNAPRAFGASLRERGMYRPSNATQAFGLHFASNANIARAAHHRP